MTATSFIVNWPSGVLHGITGFGDVEDEGFGVLMSEGVWGDEAARRDGGEGTRESRTKK